MILYQDQVIEVAMALAGFTAGQADGLRRSITRKRSKDAMAAHWKAVPRWGGQSRASMRTPRRRCSAS